MRGAPAFMPAWRNPGPEGRGISARQPGRGCKLLPGARCKTLKGFAGALLFIPANLTRNLFPRTAPFRRYITARSLLVR